MLFTLFLLFFSFCCFIIRSTGGCVEVEGSWWKVVVRPKGRQKREASSEKPKMSKVTGENTLRKHSNTVEFVVLFKGQKQGDGGFKEFNPLRVTNGLESQIGEVFQAKVLANRKLSVFCKDRDQYGKSKQVGKLVEKVESFHRERQQGLKGVIY